MAGLTPSGFVSKDYQTILDEMKTSVRASPAFGPEAQLHSATLMGSFLSVVALQLAPLWEAAVAIYQMWDARQAGGTALDNLLVLAGTARLPAAGSTVTLTFTGAPGTVIALGTVVELTGTAYQVETDTGGTIPGGGSLDLVSTCTITGPIALPAGGVTTLVTVNPGISSVTNALDGTPGRNIETDTEARARLDDILTNPDGVGLDTLYGDIQAVSGVEMVRAFRNDLDAVDADGRPGHSLEVVVFGTYTASNLADAIWTAKPAGIESYGTSSTTLTDSQGDTQTVYYTDATGVPIFTSLTAPVLSNGSSLTAAKQSVIRLAIMTAFSGTSQTDETLVVYQTIGIDVYYEVLRAAAFGVVFSDGSRLISGTFRIGLSSPAGLAVDIAIDNRSVASLDGADVEF